MRACLFFLISACICLKLAGQTPETPTFDPMKFDRKWVLGSDTAMSKPIGSDSVARPPMPTLLQKANSPLLAAPKAEVLNFKMEEIPAYIDYSQNIYGLYPINDKSWITTARVNDNYIGLGGYSAASAAYNRQLTSFMTLTTGASLSKFNVYNTFYNDITLNSNLRVALGDRFFINAFGSYSPLEKMNPSLVKSLNMSAYPASNFGGSFEFKVTEKWGVMTGVQREFDAFRGKWVNRPFIMPVFYSK